jgi:hypothetical protein
MFPHVSDATEQLNIEFVITQLRVKGQNYLGQNR